MIQLKIIGVRGTVCKSVALIFSNRQELTVTNAEAKRLLGKKRFLAYAKQENPRMNASVFGFKAKKKIEHKCDFQLLWRQDWLHCYCCTCGKQIEKQHKPD